MRTFLSSLSGRILVAGILFLLLQTENSNAQCVSLTTLGSPYTQDFNTLSNTAGSTTNNLTILGWYLTEGGGGLRDNEQYAVDPGSSTTGDMYSYGSAASTERALGQLRSGTLIPLFGSCYTNNTGATITSIIISYTGEQWRFGGVHSTVAERMDFQFSTDATSLSTGSWIDIDPLDFIPSVTTGSAGALNGNASGMAISSTITGLSIPNGATFWIRWNDLDATGADDGLAIDDFSLTPNCTPPPTPGINVSGSTTICAGGSVQLGTNFEAGVKWYLDGNLISTNSFIFATLAGSYTATITQGGCASAPSAPVVVIVNPAPPTPSITASGPTTFCEAGSVTLSSSSAEGNQWYRDGSPIGSQVGPNLIVNSSGSYTVVVTAGGCSSTSASTAIVVNPLPSFGSTITQPTTCQSTDGSIQLSPTGAPGPYTFFWTGPGIVQGAQNQSNLGVGSYSVLITIDATDCSATFFFELTGPGNCNVVVTGCPLIGGLLANPASAVCAGSSIDFTASGLSEMGSAYGITFKYSSTQLSDPYTGGTEIATVTNANLTSGGTEATITTNFPIAGDYYIYAIVSPTPEDQQCRSSQELSITIIPTPDVTATPTSQTVCSESAITEIEFSGSIPQTEFIWTRDKTTEVTGIDPDGVGNISGVVYNTTNIPQLVTFTITPGIEDAVTCYGTPITVTILVNPMPYPWANPGDQTVCSGVAITPIVLTSSVAGSVMSWSRDETVNVTGIAANGTGNITGALVNTTNAPITVTFTISSTYTNNDVACTCNPITATVTVNPLPSFSPTVIQPSTCVSADGSIQLEPPVSRLADIAVGYTFFWTGPGIVQGSPNQYNLIVGSYSVKVTDDATGCFTTYSFNLTGPGGCGSCPTLDAIATPSSQTACSDFFISNIILSGSVPGTEFTWTRDKLLEVTGLPANGTGDISGFVINTTNDPVLVTFTITPTYDNNGNTCTGSPITATVLVNPTPYPWAYPNNQTVCSGEAINPIVLTSSLPGSTFSWSRDNTGSVTGIAANGTGNISGTLVNTTSSPITVTFTITATYTNNNVSCTCSPITATVTVNPTPVISITGGGTFCSGSTPTIEATAGFDSYSWIRYGTPGVQGTNPGLQVSKSGTYLVTAGNSFDCSSDAETVVQIGDFVFNSSLSAGSTTNTTRLSHNESISTCAAPKLCPGTSIATGPFVYNLHTLTNPNPNPVCAIISVNAICFEFLHSSAYLGSYDPSNHCTNYLGDMGTGVADGTLPFEVTIPGGATLVIKVGNAIPGSYCNNYQLVVDIPRVTPGITVAPDINICSGEQVTLTASLANSYLWNPGGATTNSITVSPNPTTTYDLTLGYGNNGCTDNVQQTIYVSPTAVVTATPLTQTICSGGSITEILVSSNVQNAQLDWTRDHTGDVTGMPGSGSGNINGSLINTTNAPITVTFTITASSVFNRENTELVIRGCPSQPLLVTVTVNPIPDITASPLSQTICSGNIVINLSSDVTGTVFSWTRDNNILVTGLPETGSGPGDISGSLVNTTNAPITVTFTITPGFTNGGVTCSNDPVTVTIIVKPMPTVSASIPSQGICGGQSINPIYLTGDFAGTQFNWTRDNTGLVTGIPASGIGSITGTLTNFSGVNARVTFTITPSLDGCIGTPITVTVDVSPPVTGILSLATNTQLCAGMNGGILVNLIGAPSFNGSFTIKNLTTNAVDLFIWSSPVIGGPQNITIPASYLPNTTGTPITYQISFYTLSDANGCTGMLSGNVNITVYPRPVLLITDPPPGNTCSGNGVNFTVTELNNMPGGFAVIVRDGNEQIIGTYSNQPYGVFHFDVAACSAPGPISFTFTANGPGPLACESITVIRTINITDNQAPALNGSLPGGNSPNTCSDNAPAAPSQATIRLLYTDNCTTQAALIITGPVSNLTTNGCSWTKTYTYTITDGCGNSASAVVTYTGSDNQAPTWTTVAGSLNRTVDYCDAGAQYAAEALVPQASDNCTAAASIVITKTPGVFVEGSCPTTGTITNTFIAMDACGNQSIAFTQIITVVDNNGPSFLANIPTILTSTCAATVANYITGFGITAQDCRSLGSTLPWPPAITYNNNASGNNLIWQSPAPGSIITAVAGTVLPISIMARDGCGNTAIYTINVLVSNITGSISGTTQVQQNAATSSPVTFTGSANGAPAGTQQYRFNYSLSTNGGTFIAQAPVTTLVGQNSITVSQSNATVGTFAYRLDAITDLTSMCNGVIPGNNTATITVGLMVPVDFTPVMASGPLGLSFPTTGTSKDFIVGVINISSSFPSSGQVILRLVKGQGFSYTIGAATTSVFGTAVNNNDWLIDTGNPFFVVFTLKPAVVIPANGGSMIGFTVTRNASVAAGTTQNMTSIIQNGSGGDSNNANNTTSMAITAQ